MRDKAERCTEGEVKSAGDSVKVIQPRERERERRIDRLMEGQVVGQSGNSPSGKEAGSYISMWTLI